MADETPKVTPLDVEEIKLHLDKMDKGFSELKKQFESIQTSLDYIYKDRDLLTDLANDILKVRQLVINSDKHNEVLTEKVVETVEKKTEAVQTEVVANSQSLQTKIVHGIHKAFTKEEAKLIKLPWYKKLIFWRKGSTVNVAV